VQYTNLIILSLQIPSIVTVRFFSFCISDIDIHTVQDGHFCHGTSVRTFAFLVNISLTEIQILCHANIPAMSATVEVVDMYSHGKKQIVFCPVSAFG
jgi:hypothetical protein